MITERSAVMLISTNLISIKAVIDMFWKLTNQDFNICLVDVYNMKIMAYLHAFPSLPPSSPSPPPRLAFLSRPKSPFPYFERLPRSSAVFDHCIDQAYLKARGSRS